MTAAVAGVARGAATRGAGGAAAKKTAGARVTKAAEQRAAIEAIKSKRKPVDEPDVEPETEESSAEDTELEAAGRKSSRLPRITVNTKSRGTGGGVVLGTMLYVVGLTYLRGGKPAVKALVRAKFLNKVGT